MLTPSIILSTLFWKTSSQRSGGQKDRNVAHPCPSRRYTNIKHDNEELPWNKGRNKQGEVTRTFVPSYDEVCTHWTHLTEQKLSCEADASYAAGQSAIKLYYGVLASTPLTANKSRSNAQNEILEGKLSDADPLSTCLFYKELMCLVCWQINIWTSTE